MIQPSTLKDRHVIPRWNSFNIAVSLGEAEPVKRRTDGENFASDEELSSLIDVWKYEKNLPLAIEIISAAKLSSNEMNISNITEYAKRTIENMDIKPQLLIDILDDSKASDTKPLPIAHRTNISQIKKKLFAYPNNALLWTELAREYLILGQLEKSKKAIHTAFGLTPNNRNVIRAISRYYTHIGDSEQARYYLRNSEIIKSDPWVLSAEIAICNSMGRTSNFVKTGQKVLYEKNINPSCLSELASELGTMDFSNGDSKHGKKKLLIAKEKPHENACAQMGWINENMYNIETIISQISEEPECNFEAEACLQYNLKNWDESLGIAGLWLEYQPFSRDPALLSSFIAADLVMDYAKAKEAIDCGYESNPNDIAILNNYIYIYALNDKLDEAIAKMKIADSKFDIHENVQLTATSGFILYRSGKPDDGEQRYLAAMDLAKKQKNDELYYKAAIYYAREKKRIGKDISCIMKTIDNGRKHEFFSSLLPLIDNFDLNEI